MRKKIHLVLIVGVIAILSLGFPARAESELTGNFLFGFRFVDTSGPGSNYKYKEDINLQAGARLYTFSLAYRPDNHLRQWLDRLEFRMANFGGDPFESLSLSLQKYGRYTMTYERKKAAYFYQDLHEPGGRELYDVHTFDFDRVVDTGRARISLNKRVDLTFHFDRFTKKGQSLTSQDVERVEFELEKPVEEEAKEIGVGLNLHFHRFSLSLEERKRDYRSENSLFLPGYSDGGAGATYPSSLDYYFLNQPYELKSYLHTFRLSGRPINKLFIAARALITQDDMDLDYSERAAGLTYLGRIFRFEDSGQGSFDRDTQLYDVDLTYVLMKRFSLIGAFRYARLDQSGALQTQTGKETVDFGYDSLTFDAGLQLLLSRRLSLTFGYRNETRNLDGLETATYEFETRRQGYFGHVRWDWRGLGLTFDYERSASQEPFTLMSATDFDRMRFTARYRWKDFSLAGTYLWADSEGEVFEQGFSSSRNELSLRGGYHSQRVQAFIGYSTISVEHEASRSVIYPPFWTGPGGAFLWAIFYEGKSSLLDASVTLRLKDAWKLGFYGNSYANKGSWEIRRAMLKAYVEVTLGPGYIAQLGYRYIDFKEKSSGFNDYRASLLELSFGYRWQ